MPLYESYAFPPQSSPVTAPIVIINRALEDTTELRHIDTTHSEEILEETMEPLETMQEPALESQVRKLCQEETQGRGVWYHDHLQRVCLFGGAVLGHRRQGPFALLLLAAA